MRIRGGDPIELVEGVDHDAPDAGVEGLAELALDGDAVVALDGDEVDFEDFEDGVSDFWEEELSPGVGDYAALYQDLQDLDPCRSNRSVQVAFVDNGVVVPGTGGSPCTTWCYGPGGYIVNNTGGLMGPEHYITNRIVSPKRPWPAG